MSTAILLGMSDWADYIKAILKDKLTEDAALVGFYNKAVLASKPGGFMAAISPPELEALMGRDRGNLLEMGTTIGGQKVLVIRDGMISGDTELRFMDLRTKGVDGKAITVVKTHKILVFLMGKRGVHAGFIHKRACAIASYLKEHGV
ncbi:profilin-3-like [Alosa sapidissima]|uniref:profilin-3-like n=1 Tax=Alosa sapidissima TaxID=34773 RepID=UPI001C082211|nr:profilin-3-like [Alosa sapidissima]